MVGFDINAIQTPYYIIDEKLLIKNLEILRSVSEKTGAHILLAQKAFSMFELYPLIGRYLHGTTASSLFEARLGYENMGGETHIFAPVYKEDEIDEILSICGHIVFNSFSQWKKYRKKALIEGVKCGIRVNPELSTQEHAIYDPCTQGSRLGVTKQNFRPDLLEGISGLHFHTLCEQNADDLIKTLAVFEEKFGMYLPEMEWVNFGGGHHITREDYDIPALISCIKRFKEKYDVEVYLEPGEAVSLNAGYLVSSVLDIIDNNIKTAVLDTSAACHMPDVLEMPYRPNIIGGGPPDERAYAYRLGGNTCLAGDIIGDYSFDKSLKAGDKLVFCDMAHYTMVKNNTFNGINLPSIAVAGIDGKVRLIRSFGYEDFKNRLS